MRKVFTIFLFLFGIGALFNITVNANTLVIVIDAGHGGYDGGACVDEIKEADINLAISIKLAEVFSSNGYKVVMTRTTDCDLSTDDSFRKKTDIQNRVDIINNSDAVLFLSIHQNYYTNSIYNGAQVFYSSYNYVGGIIAAEIQSSIINNLNNTTRVAKAIDGIYLLDNTDIPGVLIECGFMSNEEELNNLLSDDYQELMANAIYLGCLNYLLTI